MKRALALGLLAASTLLAPSATARAPGELPGIPGLRVATFNASLNRSADGELRRDLSNPDASTPNVLQIRNVAEVIQIVRPHVLLINEFDFDLEAARLFQENFLSVSQKGQRPIRYGFRFIAPSNTGVPSGHDLNNDGRVGGPDDAFGFGFFPGQFGMLVLSQFRIDTARVRTFQTFLWKDMPNNLIPPGWYSPEEQAIFRLSSKSHWDVPIRLGEQTLHFLVSHPTPPVFDGPEDRNGRRNHDEIRFWADYVDPSRSRYIYDDDGRRGGLRAGAHFVIAGDQNADPFDGDSVPGAAQQLLNHRLVNARRVPFSSGALEQTILQRGANTGHRGPHAYDTADFSDREPGNLRVDYVLPSRRIRQVEEGVFWPVQASPLFRLVGTFDVFWRSVGGFPTTDHRLVWIKILVPGAPGHDLEAAVP